MLNKSAAYGAMNIRYFVPIRRAFGFPLLAALAFSCALDFQVSATPPPALTGSTNVPPLVTILSPADGTVLAAPTNLFIDARATDPDGTIATLAWFSGTNRLAEIHYDFLEQTVEHEYIFSYLPGGDYTFTAVAM